MKQHEHKDLYMPHKGVAYEYVGEDEHGLYISNGEYMSYVNFCPFCGEKSKKQYTGKEGTYLGKG